MRRYRVVDCRYGFPYGQYTFLWYARGRESALGRLGIETCIYDTKRREFIK